MYYEILTGRPVFDGTLADITLKKLNGEFLLPSQIDPSLKEFDEIFKKCLSPNKDERYSLDELLQALSKDKTITNMTITNIISTSNNVNDIIKLSLSQYIDTPYLLAIVAEFFVKLDRYNDAIELLKILNKEVDCKDVIKMVEDHIKYGIYTKEEIMKKIEELKEKIR